MRISIAPFRGRIPRVSDRGLPDANSMVAENCDMRSGEVRPFRKAKLVESLGFGNIGTIHRWDSGAQKYWLRFPGNVDVVNGPLADDVWQRIYWTGDENHNEPRMSYTPAIHQGGEEYPVTSYKLGVPAPKGQIQAAVTTPVIHEIASIEMARPMVVTTTEPHGYDTGEVVELNITAEAPGSDESDLAELLNGNEFQITVVTDTTFRLNFTDGDAVDYSAFVSGTVEQYAGEDRQDVFVYVDTYVTDIGEEGPPSNASPEIRATAFQEKVLTLQPIEPEAGEGRLITKRRIYRISAGTQSGQFQFLAEIPVTQTEYADNTRELSRTIPSIAWDPPPAEMKGLRVAPQGFAVGFFDNVVCVSEPYRLHAWPTDYRFSLDSPVVSVEIIDGGIVVATTGRPYVIQGIDPRSMTPRRIELNHACVSPRSMVSLGYAAVFASSEGLVYINNNRAELITERLVTDKEWSHFKPETIKAYELNGRYVAFYGGESDGAGFFLDPREMDLGLVDLSFWVKDAYRDLREPFLYFVDESNDIWRWDDPDEDPGLWRWRSKVFGFNRPLCFSAMKVAGVVPEGRSLTLRFIVDGVQAHEAVVVPGKFARLPAVRGTEFQVECLGDGALQEIHFAESAEELKQ